MVRMNKVAPVIIKDCREEFQDTSDLKDNVVMGSMGNNMPEHPLVQGSFFLVSDHAPQVDALKTLRETRTPNFHRVHGQAPVYASGQPSVNGLHGAIKRFTSDGHQNIFVFNLREEPILFMGTDGDLLPYSLRHRDKLRRLFYSHFSPLEADENEAAVRKEVMDLASLSDNKTFYFYNHPPPGANPTPLEPQQLTLTVEDQLMTSTEVLTSHSFTNHNIKCRRLCFPQNRAPAEETVDDFLDTFKENPTFLNSSEVASFPVLYFVCGTGKGRSTLGKAMGCLLHAHKVGFPEDLGKVGGTKGSCDPHGPLGDLRAVRQLVEEIEHGWKIKKQVDWVIERCSTLTNLSACVLETKARLDAIAINNSIEGDHLRDHLYHLCQEYTERYLFLVCFNTYLHEQFSQGLRLKYSQWLQRRPALVCCLCNLDLSKRTEPASLITSGQRILVSDSYIGLDVLSSKMDISVANFRRQMGLPVYGMAQPARDGLSRVVNHLLHKKQGYGEVAVINLRNDMTLEFDEATYHVQDAGHLGEPVQVYGATGKEMEACEEALLKEVKGKKSVKVYEELSDPAMSKTFQSALTPDDLWQQQRLQTLDMSYIRLPIQYDHGLQEKEFDAIQQLLFSYMKTDERWKSNYHAFVFHCRTGKSRTSQAMAAASMLFYHIRGFPYGAKPGEQEMVSCPNRSYTLGEFVVVMRLVRRLPEGHQRKREVDLVLDRLFETMSPMHYHLREVIFVKYNKIKTAQTDEQRQEIRRQSLDLLERYMYLILYNTYLAQEKQHKFRRSFSTWMREVASVAGVYDILDNLDFTGLEKTPSILFCTRQERWRARHADVPFYGQYV